MTFADGATVRRAYEYNRRGQRTRVTDTLIVAGGSPSGDKGGELRYQYGSLTSRLTAITSLAVTSGGVLDSLGTIYFQYDAGGQRIMSHLATGSTLGASVRPDSTWGTRTYYINDGADVALTLVKGASSWRIHQRYLATGLDEMAAVRISINGTPTNVATVGDRQNGFIMAVDAQGDEVPEAGFYVKGPYGQQEPGTSAATSGHTGLGFTGAGAPNTSGGYVYLRNRWYDPGTGRFLSQDPIGLAGGVNLYAYAGNDPVTFSDPFGLDPCESSSAWTECLAQALANWGASRGGTIGAIALNLGAALNAGLEASGINFAASAGDDIGSGEIGSGGPKVALAIVPFGRTAANGLRGASAGLTSLFANGSLRNSSIIGIRSTLRNAGFRMGISESNKGYLFTNSLGEQVRVMRRAGKWDVRVRNKAGNYLDEYGNNALPDATHNITVQSR